MGGTAWHKMAQNWRISGVIVPLIRNTFNNSVRNFVHNSAHRGILEQVVQFLSGGVCAILCQFVPAKITAYMHEREKWHMAQRSTFYKNKSKERREFIKNVYTRARGCAAQIFGNSEQLERLKNGSLQNTKSTLSNRT